MSVPGSNPFAQAAPPAAPDSPNVSDTDDLLVVSGATYLTFGMHQNSSYEFVAEQHPDYCGYCLSLTDTVGAMKQYVGRDQSTDPGDHFESLRCSITQHILQIPPGVCSFRAG